MAIVGKGSGRGGGTGRRARLKLAWANTRVGSNPTLGITGNNSDGASSTWKARRSLFRLAIEAARACRSIPLLTILNGLTCKRQNAGLYLRRLRPEVRRL